MTMSIQRVASLATDILRDVTNTKHLLTVFSNIMTKGVNLGGIASNDDLIEDLTVDELEFVIHNMFTPEVYSSLSDNMKARMIVSWFHTQDSNDYNSVVKSHNSKYPMKYDITIPFLSFPFLAAMVDLDNFFKVFQIIKDENPPVVGKADSIFVLVYSLFTVYDFPRRLPVSVVTKYVAKVTEYQLTKNANCFSGLRKVNDNINIEPAVRLLSANMFGREAQSSYTNLYYNDVDPLTESTSFRSYMLSDQFDKHFDWSIVTNNNLNEYSIISRANSVAYLNKDSIPLSYIFKRGKKMISIDTEQKSGGYIDNPKTQVDDINNIFDVIISACDYYGWQEVRNFIKTEYGTDLETFDDVTKLFGSSFSTTRNNDAVRKPTFNNIWLSIIFYYRHIEYRVSNVDKKKSKNLLGSFISDILPTLDRDTLLVIDSRENNDILNSKLGKRDVSTDSANRKLFISTIYFYMGLASNSIDTKSQVWLNYLLFIEQARMYDDIKLLIVKILQSVKSNAKIKSILNSEHFHKSIIISDYPKLEFVKNLWHK